MLTLCHILHARKLNTGAEIHVIIKYTPQKHNAICLIGNDFLPLKPILARIESNNCDFYNECNICLISQDLV